LNYADTRFHTDALAIAPYIDFGRRTFRASRE